MSSSAVRQAQAAARTVAVQAATEVRRHDAQHAHHGHPGAGHRGQFGGFVFRLARAPAAPPPRRPVPLRRRPPTPPGANAAGMEHEHEQGPMSNMALLPQSSAVEDEERAAAMDVDAMDRHGDAHDGLQEQQSRQRWLALQWRVGSRPRPDAGDALLAGLEAAGGPGVQLLWAHTAPNAPLRADDLAGALVQALAGVNTADTPRQFGPGITTLQLAAVRAYLMKRQQAGVAGRALATLERVKLALLESRRPDARRPASAVPEEAQQNRNLLLPLKLLNADRPRTAEQLQQACCRIELACQAGPAMGHAEPAA